jgi:hypothetical protein
VDPGFEEHGISIPAFRFTVDDPDADGDRWWRFAGRVQWRDGAPAFGITLLVLDELGLPLDTYALTFSGTIDKNVNVVEGSYFGLKKLPSEAQLVMTFQ